MRILLGTDIQNAITASTLQLLQRLRFNAARIETVHVVVPPPFPVWDSTAQLLQEAIQAEECRAKGAVNAVAKELGETSAGVTVLHGNATAQLLQHADETDADLIAVNGHENSPVMAVLIGSVARGLVIGAHQSVLVARPSLGGPNRPIRAVLATDHSEYADKCWERLMHFWPRGISHLTILTAYPEERLKGLEPILPVMGVSPTQAIYDNLVARNDALATRLSNCFHPACTSIDSVISTLPVHEAIAAQLKASDADLLILGAKGHGFLERLSLGSVALQETLSCPKSVLVVRA